jgi:amidase
MSRKRARTGSTTVGVSRRELLQAGAAAGVAVAAGAMLPAAGAAGEPVAPPLALEVPRFDLEEMTIAELQAGMQAGRWTSRSVTDAYLDRVAAVDGSLRSVIEVNPEARLIADQMDAERVASGARGPLHGIPVLVKDNFATADQMQTTAGSLALVGAKARDDAFVVARLRKAGAVLLGKTNLSEWANLRSDRSSSGWSGRGGQCRNPYALDRSPGGSSSGTGAAVAASLAAAGVGTETDGSILCPAHLCGLVGIKPTLGLVSRAGIVPVAHSQDTAGPMARTVADAVVLLEAMAAPDPRDPATAAAGRPEKLELTRALDPGGLKGARIGVARTRLFGYSREADRLAEEAVKVMAGLGATIVDPADIPHVGEYDGDELEVLLYELKADLEAYLATWTTDAPVATLKDLVAFNESHRDQELRYFGQELLVRAAAKGALTDARYLEARARCLRLAREEGLDALFARLGLDAVVAPTGGPAWPVDLVNGDHLLGSSTTPAAVSGYPSITVPAGLAFGLPVGITFIGRAWSEPTLVRLAYAFEQATRNRKPPRFLFTAELG